VDERDQGMQNGVDELASSSPISNLSLFAAAPSSDVQCGRIATRTLHTTTIPRSNTTHSTPRWLADLVILWAVCHRHPCPRWQSAPSPTPPNVCTPRSLFTLFFSHACLSLPLCNCILMSTRV